MNVLEKLGKILNQGNKALEDGVPVSHQITNQTMIFLSALVAFWVLFRK